MTEKNCFDMTKLICQIICVTAMQWSSSCLNVQINRVRLPKTLFSVFCTVFFSVWSLFLTIFFLLDQYILILSPEFYFEKGISKALDLHTGQSYDQKKNISYQDMCLLWNSCTNLHPTPTTGDPLAKVKPVPLYIVLIINIITLKSPLGKLPPKNNYTKRLLVFGI